MIKILLCDDEESLLNLYQEEIEDAFDDIKLFFALNGQEGLEIAKREKVEYVFTDGKMPIMGGLKLASELKKLDSPPQVFMITGYAGTYDEEEIKATGILKIFDKPVNYDELIEFIAKFPRS